MKVYLITLCLFLALTRYAASLQIHIIEKMSAVMHSLEDCHKNKSLIYYANSSIANIGGGRTVFNGVLIIEDNAGPLTSVKILVYKCKVRQGHDCEFFLSSRYDDACKFLTAKDDVWTPFINHSTPLVTCEAKKGTYVYKNAYFDFSKAAQIQVFLHNNWRMRSEIYSGKRLVHCEVVDFELVTLNNRKSRKNNSRSINFSDFLNY